MVKEVILSVAVHEATDLPHLTQHLTSTYKKPLIWKPLLQRLLLLEALIPELHVHPNKSSDKSGAFDLAAVVAFAGAGFPNSNGDVRAAAVRVATLAFREGVRTCRVGV